uniref:Uncharacterized protein n=1 Tax=Tanacetum cinerariifolium TaxID=118510 RepID=A0A699I7V1_TANCI|nr:hypothetical protein [Tanacetum cinerariifolium]
MLENGRWFIRNHPLILCKWNPNVDLLKEDVGNAPVWVKLYSVPIMAFTEDGLSAIATKFGTSLMLDSYTSDMCLQSWGMASYARVMIELRADVELKDNIVMDMPKIIGEGYYTCTIRVEYEWKPPRCSCCKVFDHTQEECLKNIRLGVTKNLKKPSQISRGVLVGTNRGTINLVNNEANLRGSSFMNVKNSSTSNTPIIDKIRKFEDLLIDGQAILVGEAGFGTLSLLEQLRDSYGNGDYDKDLYDDDMYEGHDLSQ